MARNQLKDLDKEMCVEMGRTCACANLRRAARAVTKMYDRSLRPTGLRGTQFFLLMAVRVLEPVPVTTLAKNTLMDRTTLGRNLKLLENRGLIEITQGDDQRVRKVSLTESGKKAMTTAIPYWKEAQERIEDGLGKQGLENLLGDLSAVTSLVRKI